MWVGGKAGYALFSATAPVIELTVGRSPPVSKLVPNLLVFISDATAVLGIVLPVLDANIVSIDVPVEVEVLINIDVDIAVPPIEIVPEGIANGKGRSPSKTRRQRSAPDLTGFWLEVVRRVVCIRPIAANN